MGKKGNSKLNLTPAISLSKREIYFIELDPHSIYCQYCRKVVKIVTTCNGCGRHLSPDNVQRGTRPVIIIHAPLSNVQDRENDTVLAIPLSTTEKTFLGGVIMPADEVTQLNTPSQALVFQLGSYDRRKFFQENKKGRVGDREWEEIITKLKSLLGIDETVIKVDGKELHVNQIQDLMLAGQLSIKIEGENTELVKKLEATEYNFKQLKNRLEDHKRDFEKKTKEECGVEIKKLKEIIRKQEKEISDLKKKEDA